MWKALLGANLLTKVDKLGTYASALAYCVVLSLVPFLGVTFAVGLQISSQLAMKDDAYARSYADVLHSILPMEDTSDTQHILDVIGASRAANDTKHAVKSAETGKIHPARGGLLTIGFILALYTSFNLMDQIIRTLLFIFDDPRRPSEWSWKVVGKGLALLGIWMCLLLLISISAVEASGLRHLLDRYLLPSLSEALVAAVQLCVVIGALFGTLYFTYYLVPTRAFPKKYTIEGSMLGSFGWILCSLIFAFVIPNLLKTSAAYIALGSVVAILLWAQACAWSIILGACWIVRFSTPRGKEGGRKLRVEDSDAR